MSKAVDKAEFWKERIDTAVKDHFMVYVTNENEWKRINRVHQEHFKMISGKVLDAGCGYGRNSELFADYTGVDFSPDFIALAEKKYPGKTFIQADLKQLPFEDHEFDWAIIVSVKTMIINNLGVETWEPMEAEIRRVAKKVLVVEYEDPEPYEVL